MYSNEKNFTITFSDTSSESLSPDIVDRIPLFARLKEDGYSEIELPPEYTKPTLELLVTLIKKIDSQSTTYL